MRSLPIGCLFFHFVAVLAVFILVTQPIFAERPPDGYARPPIHLKGGGGSGPSGYSPAQIRHAYGLDTISNSGVGQTIAIVDAYDDPNIASDLATFKAKFGVGP